MKLSIIVASRNDDHGEFLTERTNLFIDTLVKQAEKYKLDGELIIVEWNPPANRKPLSEELSWPATPRHFPVRVITVPHELHKRFNSSDKLPFFQMIAKNVGARRARGGFVLFTNIDILFANKMIRYLARVPLEPQKTYRANRHDTKAMPQMRMLIQERLELCRAKTFQIWERQPRVKLHLPACGDFTLIDSNTFACACGHSEFEGFSIHLDSVLCLRLADVFGCQQEIIPFPIYHIDHDDKYSAELLCEVKQNGVPVVDAVVVSSAVQAYLAREKLKRSHPTVYARQPRGELENKIYHHEKWGLAGADLQEWQPPTKGIDNA